MSEKESSAGETRHEKARPSHDPELRFLRLKGFLIDTRSHDSVPARREEARRDLETLTPEVSDTVIRRLERKWKR
jgi:hypothetical protein